MAVTSFKQNNFVKENRKPFTAIKTQTKYKNLSQKNITTLWSCFRKRDASKKLHRYL